MLNKILNKYKTKMKNKNKKKQKNKKDIKNPTTTTNKLKKNYTSVDPKY